MKPAAGQRRADEPRAENGRPATMWARWPNWLGDGLRGAPSNVRLTLGGILCFAKWSSSWDTAVATCGTRAIANAAQIDRKTAERGIRGLEALSLPHVQVIRRGPRQAPEFRLAMPERYRATGPCQGGASCDDGYRPRSTPKLAHYARSTGPQPGPVSRDSGPAPVGSTTDRTDRTEEQTTTDDGRCRAFGLLRGIGVTESSADRLASSHDEKRIERVVSAARDKSNPPGWAVGALDDEWELPPEQKSVLGPVMRALLYERAIALLAEPDSSTAEQISPDRLHERIGLADSELEVMTVDELADRIADFLSAVVYPMAAVRRIDGEQLRSIVTQTIERAKQNGAARTAQRFVGDLVSAAAGDWRDASDAEIHDGLKEWGRLTQIAGEVVHETLGPARAREIAAPRSVDGLPNSPDDMSPDSAARTGALPCDPVQSKPKVG